MKEYQYWVEDIAYSRKYNLPVYVPLFTMEFSVLGAIERSNIEVPNNPNSILEASLEIINELERVNCVY